MIDLKSWVRVGGRVCMNYLLILCTVLLLVIQTLCFKEFTRTYMKNVASYFIFNFLFFCVVVVIFFATGISTSGFDLSTVVLGALFGVVFIITIFCYMKAMETGPLSFTILFSSFGIMIPVFIGLIFWNEPINIVQIMGLILLFTTFYLGSGSSKGKKQKMNMKWLVFCMINFLGNGIGMTITKWHQILLPGIEIKEYLVMSFGTAALLSLAMFVYYHYVKKEVIVHLKRVHLVYIILATGIVTAFGNQLFVFLASRIPGVIQFPAINGGIVILSTIASCFIFKDKLTRNVVIGMSLGIVALVLISA